MIYVVSKILTSLLLPPGLLVLLLAVAAWKVRTWRIFFATFAFFLYLLSIDPVSNPLLRLFEDPYRHTPLFSNADVVVSLGGHKIPSVPIPLSDETLKRHLYALAIGRKLDIPVIITGTGRDGYSDYEALKSSLATLRPILRADATDFRKDFGEGYAIVPETESVDTFENARNTMALIKDRNASIVIVTSAYHMRRALRLFRLAGASNLHPAAVNFYTHGDRPLKWRDFLPTIWSLLNSYRALHEALGMVKVWTRERVQMNEGC